MLRLSGVPFGFIPADGDGDGGGLSARLARLGPNEWLVVAGVTHLDGAALHAVRDWRAARGGGLLLLGGSRDELFAFWENGFRVGWEVRRVIGGWEARRMGSTAGGR